MPLVHVGKNQYRYSIKVVSAEDDCGELEQLVTVQSNLAPGGRSFQARLPQGFFITRRTVADLVREAQRAGWVASAKGSVFLLNWRCVSTVPEEKAG